ncbi:hypothetical protein WJX84_008791 [Apatococcus fuscideae]|uniref:Proteasome assembly chaperone 1 n=1 Tax=Apatococcus fuscideae TaxID=2026836 RepID=A0AAW1TCZ1_9CHLO
MDFDPLTADFPERLEVDEEQEALAQTQPETHSPLVLWSSNMVAELQDSTLAVSQLVIGCSTDWLALLRLVPNKLEIVGSIILANHSLASSCLHPNLKDSTCLLVRAVGQPSLLVLCQYPVPDEQAVLWAETLYAHIKPEQTLIFASQPSRSFSIHNSEDPCCYALMTDRARSRASGKCRVPGLPAGQLLTGLPAALLSLCQVRQLEATMLVSDQAGAQYSRLQQLQRALSALLTTLPGQWSWLNLQEPAVRQAAKDLAAASPAARASLYA